MKRFNLFLTAIFILSLIFLIKSPFAFGNSPHHIDREVFDVLISDMEKTLYGAETDQQLIEVVPLKLSIAELYADRARVKFMEEMGKECKNCLGSKQDREKSLRLLIQIQNQVRIEQRGPLLLLKARIYDHLENKREETRIYRTLIRESQRAHSRKIIFEARFQLGEILLREGKHNEARQEFQQALSISDSSQKGPVLHRLAWCDLNLGNESRARNRLRTILENPNYLTQMVDGVEKLDKPFFEEVARDYAVLLARQSRVSSKELQVLTQLAPEFAVKEILKDFAKELERLGQPQSALMVWQAYRQYITDSVDVLDVKMHRIQIFYSLEDWPGVSENIEKMAKIWRSEGCVIDKDRCWEIRGRFRQLLSDWQKLQSQSPSRRLMRAFYEYQKLFVNDTEMVLALGSLADEIGEVVLANEMYHIGSQQLAMRIDEREAINPFSEEKRVSRRDLARYKNYLEATLESEVETAEKIQEASRRRRAYKNYLHLLPKGSLNYKVRYQLAYLPYEEQQWEKSAFKLSEYLQSETCSARVRKQESMRNLCIKAADLHLDSLVRLKRHRDIENFSLIYLNRFSENRMDYAKIHRTALVNQGELLLKKNKGDSELLDRMKRAPMIGASSQDRIAMLKMRVALSENLMDLEKLVANLAALLRADGLTVSDRNIALERKVWAEEMAFEFLAAYRTLAEIPLPRNRSARADRHLHLATLASLSAQNPLRHEEDFLNETRDMAARALVRANQISRNPRPSSLFLSYERELRSLPEIYGQMALLAYSKGSNSEKNKIREITEDRVVLSQSPSGVSLRRKFIFSDLEKIEKILHRHRLQTGSDQLLARSLKDRFELIAQLETLANQAITLGDNLAQVLVLESLALQNERIANEIISLPIPRHLSDEDKKVYEKALSQRAEPYFASAKTVQEKVNLAWRKDEHLPQLLKLYRNAPAILKSAIEEDLLKIRERAGFLTTLRIAYNQFRSRSYTARDYERAIERVKSSPFDKRRLRDLMKVADYRGNRVLAAYLSARLYELKKEGG